MRVKKCMKWCREKETLLHCWWGCKLVQPLWKTVWKFLKNLKVELPYDPAILLLDIYAKEMKFVPQRDMCTPMFIVALFTIAKIHKKTCAHWYINGQRKFGMYTMYYYSAVKESNFVTCDNRKEPEEHYAKWNKPYTERQTILSHSYVESKKVEHMGTKSRMMMVAWVWGRG